TARISPIHAFCTSVLREYPIEADVDPAFAILEEVDADALRRQAVRQTLETLANRADEDPDKEALRRTLGEWPRRYLDNILAGLLRKKRLARYWCHRYAEQSPQAICKHWRQMRDAAWRRSALPCATSRPTRPRKTPSTSPRPWRKTY
ncbi:UvrD-helicase domain-containing protein, partial [bacterium]|nr:UvrD-helicase domain-containing protein [bacterium]